MKAIILAGGLGTRLRPVTLEIPKPLIPVQGKTLTEHVFDVLKQGGVSEVILSIGFGADKIKKYFGEEFGGLKITYVEEKEPLGTGGWMNSVALRDEDFFVINGDNLFNLNLNEFMKFHKKNKATCTIAITEVEDPSEYGSVIFKNNKIEAFLEKTSNTDSKKINSGYYIFNKKIFGYLPKKEKFMLERELFPLLAEKGLLFGFESNAQWFDTGTFERWEEVIKKWRS